MPISTKDVERWIDELFSRRLLSQKLRVVDDRRSIVLTKDMRRNSRLDSDRTKFHESTLLQLIHHRSKDREVFIRCWDADEDELCIKVNIFNTFIVFRIDQLFFNIRMTKAIVNSFAHETVSDNCNLKLH